MNTPIASEEQWPRGWYFVAFGESLRAGEVRPVRLFGADWALFRTRSGRVGLIDPVCVHLGADMARTGKVCGERLRCALHHWEFEVDGRCTAAPRVDRIPLAARQHALRVEEHLENIWVWYGEDAAEPFLEVASLETPRYRNYVGSTFDATGDCRTVMEHTSDNYHFAYNHFIHVLHDWRPVADDGYNYAFHWIMRPDEQANFLFRRIRSLGLVEFAGPCTALYRVLEQADGRDNPLVVMVLSVTPIEPGKTLIAWRTLVRKVSPNPLMKPVSELVTGIAFRYFHFNVHQDIEVLCTMKRLARPLWVVPTESRCAATANTTTATSSPHPRAGWAAARASSAAPRREGAPPRPGACPNVRNPEGAVQVGWCRGDLRRLPRASGLPGVVSSS